MCCKITNTVPHEHPTSAVGIARAGTYGVHVYTYTACTSRECGLILHVRRPGYPYRRAYIQYTIYKSWCSFNPTRGLYIILVLPLQPR